MSDNNSEIQKEDSAEPNYWRSFNELYNDKNFIEASHNEFLNDVKEDFNPGTLSGLSRRKFLALLGASAALAGAGCNHRDKGEIIPYNKKPEEILPGTPNYYASTCTACAAACGILVKTREGRPVKIDGNPEHPINQGKICSRGQANILNLYDPERLKSPHKRYSGGVFNSLEWKDADYAIINELEKAGSKEIALVTRKIVSPTYLSVLNDFKTRFPSARIYSYELFNNSARNAAWIKTNGQGSFPLIHWNKAKIIVALESDFLGTGEDKVETIRLYSEGRDVNNIEKFNRLYVVEGNLSLTGMNADYRIRLNPYFLEDFLEMLISNLNSADRSGIDEFADKHKISSKKIISLIENISNNKSESIIYAGDSLPEKIHIIVNNFNNKLGNSHLFRTDTQPVNLNPLTSINKFEELVERMNNNLVAAVLHLESNPVFEFPSDLFYKEALQKVPLIVSLTEMENETSAEADYVLPINHNYESWGDAKTRAGFYSLQQPVIWPLFNTRQKEAILLTWISGNTARNMDNLYHDYLSKNWENNIYPQTGSNTGFSEFWGNALHDGIVYTSKEPSVQNVVLEENQYVINTSRKKYTVLFSESYAVGDGRFANNGWLQELPHPVSKVTWDNYAAISYQTAKDLQVSTNDMIEVEINGRKKELPVLVQPGTADNTIAIELGYGRYRTGVVGTGVGFNVNSLLSSQGGYSPFIYSTDNIRKVSGSYELASSQEHHIFDNDLTEGQIEKRKIIREGTLAEYKKDNNFLREGKGLKLPSVLGTHLDELYSGLKWGMAIDMNRCLGCGDCVVACNVENNVPVVGKDQVLVSREMQWIRIDRYYSGPPEDPQVLTQVMLCQHCDHAPCENVCPVVATTHSSDGLNQMAYNRCVGTRYCSNNCPYKVRRFNFFNFRDHFRDGYQENNVFSLVFNPEVTVRSRGVMEKCTFCIQRIMKGREDAIREHREFKGADITTACQDACIPNAISFGDMNDKESEIGKLRDHELGYYVLEDLNTRPNVTYIAKLRNTDQEVV